MCTICTLTWYTTVHMSSEFEPETSNVFPKGFQVPRIVPKTENEGPTNNRNRFSTAGGGPPAATANARPPPPRARGTKSRRNATQRKPCSQIALRIPWVEYCCTRYGRVVSPESEARCWWGQGKVEGAAQEHTLGCAKKGAIQNRIAMACQPPALKQMIS